MNWPGIWGVAMGTAWLSGIRLYAGILTLGLLQHFGFAHLPGEMTVLGDWWVIAVAAALSVVEFVADKVPAVDSAWDAVHTFIRIPAGAVLAAAAFANFDARIRLVAFLLGGGIALAAHGTKAATRLAVNASPEPFSNFVVSALEDAGSIGLSFLIAWHPLATLFVTAALVIIGVLFVRKLVRGVRRLFGGPRTTALDNP